MPRADYEAVIRDLTAWIATAKPGYGRQELLEQIATLQKRHEVSEDLIDRALRLFGGRLVLQNVISQLPATEPTGGGGSASPGKASGPGPTMSQEAHDGSINGAARAV
jgi:hypothetical protein